MLRADSENTMAPKVAALRHSVHRRVQLVSALTLTLMVVIVGLGAIGLFRIQRDSDLLHDHQVPAALLLLNLDRDSYQAQRSLELAIADGTADGRAAHIALYVENSDQTQQRWTEFAELNDPSETEMSIRATFEALHRRWRQQTSTLASQMTSGATPNDVAGRRALSSAQETFEQMRHQLDLLEENEYEPMIAVSSERVNSSVSTTLVELLLLLGGGLAAGLYFTRRVVRATRMTEEEARRVEAARALEVARVELDQRISTALALADTDEDAVATVSDILTNELDGLPSELLLADSSHAHLSRVARSTESNPPGCQVSTPDGCPAVRRGTAQRFANSADYHACPKLRERGPGLAALCVPVSVGGRAAGVLHVTTSSEQRIDEGAEIVLERLAARAGDRIAMIRAFARAETQARTDPLTGLLNRRSLEDALRPLSLNGTPVAIAIGDLDHFKMLNDTHGHDVGDRALRLFSKSLREALREDDLVSRWGGEEFVVALPRVSATDAALLLERVREGLARSLAGGTVPKFTCSFGVAVADGRWTIEDMIEEADAALYLAKQNGRDRIHFAAEVDEQPARTAVAVE